jgi:hypothetical protein
MGLRLLLTSARQKRPSHKTYKIKTNVKPLVDIGVQMEAEAGSYSDDEVVLICLYMILGASAQTLLELNLCFYFIANVKVLRCRLECVNRQLKTTTVLVVSQIRKN